MILLNKEQIKHLHGKLIQETGGIDGIRDEGLLESALSVPFQSFGGEELYPTIPPLTGFRKRKRSRFVSDYSSAHGDYPDINPVDSAHVEAVVLLQRENS